MNLGQKPLKMIAAILISGIKTSWQQVDEQFMLSENGSLSFH